MESENFYEFSDKQDSLEKLIPINDMYRGWFLDYASYRRQRQMCIRDRARRSSIVVSPFSTIGSSLISLPINALNS